MNEYETVARAQMYIEKLANGINPLTNEEVADDDIVNNVRISRCLSYTSGILKQIIDSKGKFKLEMPKKTDFELTPEQLLRFEYSKSPISATEITKRLNALINPVYVANLKVSSITEWLVQINMLSEITVNDRKRKRPTDNGEKIGITVMEGVNKNGFTYEGVFYNLDAQHFIIDNIDAIIDVNNQKQHK